MICFLQELFYGIQTCLVFFMSLLGESQGMNDIPQKVEKGQPVCEIYAFEMEAAPSLFFEEPSWSLFHLMNNSISWHYCVLVFKFHK